MANRSGVAGREDRAVWVVLVGAVGMFYEQATDSTKTSLDRVKRLEEQVM
jgi:hypothetical protein